MTFEIRQFYFVLGAFCLFAAMVDRSTYRFAWATFAIAFIVATDKIKDIEKAKIKERAETEIRMTQDMLKGWDESLNARYDLMTKQIANTSDTLFKQMSTYVRDASPTRTDRSSGCDECHDNSLDQIGDKQ